MYIQCELDRQCGSKVIIIKSSEGYVLAPQNIIMHCMYLRSIWGDINRGL